ncbi:MAG TPA: hypothetical protein VM509_06200 [Planctomycetota bacterium]|nr:hypothetical protein [Planctomycetota bacterium]
MSTRHVHGSPEDLLELALEESAARTDPRVAEMRGCAKCARALDEQRSELLRLRGALVSVTKDDELRAGRLARSVLGRTTREDLSWRGDWNVVRDFLRERWSSTLAVRLIAAGLLLHLLALPVLAFAYVWKTREAHSFVVRGIEARDPSAPPAEGPVEPLFDLVREAEPETPGPGSSGNASAAATERLAAARRELIASGAPHATLTEPRRVTAGAVARLLVARSQRLALESLDSSLASPAANAPLLERALWAELLLDDWAISGRADPRLALALGRLLDAAPAAREASAGPIGPVAQAQAQLAAHALQRAAAYGFPSLPDSASSAAQSTFALDAEWFRALERACGGRSEPDAAGVVAVWLEWGRRHAR